MALRPKLSNNKKRKIKNYLADAYNALREGDPEACVACCDQIDAILPNHADAVYLRGVAARELGQSDVAEAYFRQAIELAPDRADLLAALAGLYLSVGDYQQAVPVYRQVLEMDPHAVNTMIGLAGALVCLHQYDEAIAHLEQARKQRPGALDVRMGLFQACHDSGRVEEARGHLEDILKRDSDYAQAHYSMALLDIESGDLDAGMASIRKAIEALEDYSDAYAVLADLQQFAAENDDFRAMQALYGRCESGSLDRMNIAFALAKAYDDLGRAGSDQKQFAKAFAMMDEANAIRHQLSNYDEAAALSAMQALIDQVAPERLPETKGNSDPRPIFIVGMPRSGTSLVEQILAAHPDLCACGENTMFADALAAVDGSVVDPLAVGGWSQARCDAVAANYLQKLVEQDADAKRFSDKTLGNLHYVGAIARCLPAATIIHVHRDPLDTCLSVYKNNIIGDQFDYGHDLGELGRYYRRYEQLIDHWRSVVPDAHWLEIEYEQLVAEPEAQIRRLLEACGLAWDPACLAFDNADNRVLTASMTQVRRPIYSRSVGAAMPYIEQLQPLREALD